MPKKPSPSRIKRHWVYTVWEVADALDVHRKTVTRWIGYHGLPADRSKHPWLIEGNHLKTFLTDRRRKDRTKLSPAEIYCLPCRQARVPAGRMVDFRMKSATTGVLIGICPDCDRMMHRFIRRSDLEAIRTNLDVTVQSAVASIVGASTRCVSVTKKKAWRAHG